MLHDHVGAENLGVSWCRLRKFLT